MSVHPVLLNKILSSDYIRTGPECCLTKAPVRDTKMVKCVSDYVKNDIIDNKNNPIFCMSFY